MIRGKAAHNETCTMANTRYPDAKVIGKVAKSMAAKQTECIRIKSSTEM